LASSAGLFHRPAAGATGFCALVKAAAGRPENCPAPKGALRFAARDFILDP